jgi:hypothetical protein
MPRKKKRFGKLHQALKDTGYAAGSGPAGNYLKFLQGTNKLVIPRKAGADFLKTFNVGVTPFGEEPNTGSAAITAREASITIQADNIKSLFQTATDAAFGIVRDLTQSLIDPSFYAAEAIITVVPSASVASGATKTSHTSAITLRPYKSYPGVRSGSVPYGRTTTAPQAETEGGTPTTPTLATVSEEDVRLSIAQLLKKGTSGGTYQVLSLGFVPEEFVVNRSFSKAKKSDAPTGLPAN